jgi:hypothetical protein
MKALHTPTNITIFAADGSQLAVYDGPTDKLTWVTVGAPEAVIREIYKDHIASIRKAKNG